MAAAVAAEVTDDAAKGEGGVPETLPVHAYPSAVAALDEIGEGLVHVIFAEQNGLDHLLALLPLKLPASEGRRLTTIAQSNLILPAPVHLGPAVMAEEHQRLPATLR